MNVVSIAFKTYQEHLKMFSILDETFHQEVALEDHKNTHLGFAPPKKHLCTICNKGFSENRDRKRHEEIHNTDFKYQCEICGNKFRSKQVYHSHKRTQHPSTSVQKVRSN